jgi:hypothetical protein
MRNALGGTLNVALYRTQEVGGSNPPNSIESKALQSVEFDLEAGMDGLAAQNGRRADPGALPTAGGLSALDRRMLRASGERR